MQMGEAKRAYYAMQRERGEHLREHVRHPAYLVAFRPASARLLQPLFHVAGAVMLRLALAAHLVSERSASALYVAAIGCTDLAGYCRAGVRRRGVARAAGDAAASRPAAD
jgi:hypothetical protein